MRDDCRQKQSHASVSVNTSPVYSLTVDPLQRDIVSTGGVWYVHGSQDKLEFGWSGGHCTSPV